MTLFIHWGVITTAKGVELVKLGLSEIYDMFCRVHHQTLSKCWRDGSIFRSGNPTSNARKDQRFLAVQHV